jgi:hypothetical protein
MVFVAHTMQTPTHDNDNSDTWISLAAATANVVRWLQKDRDESPHGETDKNPEDEADSGGSRGSSDGIETMEPDGIRTISV